MGGLGRLFSHCTLLPQSPLPIPAFPRWMCLLRGHRPVQEPRSEAGSFAKIISAQGFSLSQAGIFLTLKGQAL